MIDIGMTVKPEAPKRVVLVEAMELFVNRQEASVRTGSIPIEVRLIGTPKSYTIAPDAPFGGKEVFVYKLTWLTPDAAAIVEQKGWHGVPSERIQYAIGKSGKYRSDFDVLFRACAGKKGWFTATADGKLKSALEGQLVEFEVENREIAKQDYEPFLASPVKTIESYTHPADREMWQAERPVGVKKAAGEASSAAPTPVSSAGPGAEELAVACQVAGALGQPQTLLNNADFAASFIMKNRAKAPVLINPAVQAAADKGELGDYLVALGAVRVDEAGILQEVA